MSEKVKVIEKHFNSMRDVEGFVVDEQEFEEGSEEFNNYLKRFNVYEKYKKSIFSDRASYVMAKDCKDHPNIKVISTIGVGYYNGRIIINSTVPSKTEYCYIIIEGKSDLSQNELKNLSDVEYRVLNKKSKTTSKSKC